jgi:hypothetical protein
MGLTLSKRYLEGSLVHVRAPCRESDRGGDFVTLTEVVIDQDPIAPDNHPTKASVKMYVKFKLGKKFPSHVTQQV